MTTTTAPATARDSSVTMLIDAVASNWLNDEHALTKSLGGLIQAALRDAGYTIVYRNTDADVEARAREVLAETQGGDGYRIGDAGANEALLLLAEDGLRIVDAAQDDRRTEALAAFRAFVRFADSVDCIGGFESTFGADDQQCRAAWRERRDTLAPYLHDDDTGGEG